MKYEVKILQEIKHEPLPESDRGWTSHEEITGVADIFEDVTALIGLVTQIFPNAEITISHVNNNKEEN